MPTADNVDAPIQIPRLFNFPTSNNCSGYRNIQSTSSRPPFPYQDGERPRGDQNKPLLKIFALKISYPIGDDSLDQIDFYNIRLFFFVNKL
jgi:hypothetical protein